MTCGPATQDDEEKARQQSIEEGKRKRKLAQLSPADLVREYDPAVLERFLDEVEDQDDFAATAEDRYAFIDRNRK
jgi:hypothetical protein